MKRIGKKMMSGARARKGGRKRNEGKREREEGGRERRCTGRRVRENEEDRKEDYVGSQREERRENEK
jgi:hypothetical protein